MPATKVSSLISDSWGIQYELLRPHRATAWEHRVAPDKISFNYVIGKNAESAEVSNSQGCFKDKKENDPPDACSEVSINARDRIILRLCNFSAGSFSIQIRLRIMSSIEGSWTWLPSDSRVGYLLHMKAVFYNDVFRAKVALLLIIWEGISSLSTFTFLDCRTLNKEILDLEQIRFEPVGCSNPLLGLWEGSVDSMYVLGKNK